MHNRKNVRYLLGFAIAGLLAGTAASAQAEVYYESVPVLDVTPIIVSKRVPVRERICEHRETDRRLAQAATGDLRRGRPVLSISEAAREDRRLWAELTASEEHCRTTERYTQHREIAGYRVEYAYGSERLVTRMDHDPGERIRVRVELDPVQTRAAGWSNNLTPSGRSRYR